MSWNPSIRSLFTLRSHPIRKPFRRRRGARPFLEVLETRLTPSSGEIHGTIWNDLNGNGIHDANEPGIAGRVVYLDQNQNGQLDPGEASTTTAADGSYALTNLALGTYTVAEVLPGGWQQSAPATASQTVTLANGQQNTITFNNLASTTTYNLGPYSEAGYTFDTAQSSNYSKFTVFGSTDAFYQGAPALSSEWAPETISLKRSSDTTPFTLASMDLAGYSAHQSATVTFTGTRVDGTTVQQTNYVLPSSATQPAFQTFVFGNFTNLRQVTWAFTGFSDYHQFRNVVLQTGGAPITTGVDFETTPLALPALSVNDLQTQDFTNRIGYANFTIQLNQHNPYPVTVHYATVDGTAQAGVDYGAVSGTLTIEANQAYRSVSVPIYSDTAAEPDKTFTLQLSNPTNATLARATGTATIVNDDPLQANNDAYSVNENNVLTVAAPGVLGNDTPAAGGGPLTAQLFTGPAHGTVTLNSDGSFTYTPQTNYHGTDSFQYHDLEGILLSNVATVQLTVSQVYQPPVAINDSYTLNEEQTLTILPAPGTTSLTMNSQPGDYIGQGRTYGYSAASGTFTASRNYDNGVSLSYTSAGTGSDWWYLDFAAPGKAPLVPGYYGNAARYPFQSGPQPGLSVDGEGRGSNTLTGNFTVNQAVYAADGSVLSYDASFEQHSEGAAAALFGEIKYNAGGGPAGVLANDTDPQNLPLTASLVSGPAHGSLTLNSDGTFTYTPNADFSGVDTFTYKANDGHLDSNVATVSLTVNLVNDPPSFTSGGDVTIPENLGPQTVPGWATNISAGPPNEAGQTVTFLVSNDNNNLFSVPPSIDPNTGNLTFTPNGDAIGTATITVLLQDNGGTANGGVDTSAQTFHITINNVPPAVTVANQTANETVGQSFSPGSFADPGAGPWSVSVDWGDQSTPTTFSVTTAGTLPAQAHTYADKGTYTATVTVTDNYQASNSGTFQVAVANVNPTIAPATNQTASEGSSASFALGSFADPDPDAPWSVAVNWGDGSAATTFTTSSAGALANQAHTYADTGNYTVTVAVTNSDQGQDSKTFQVAVATVPPTITPAANQSANEGSSTSFALGSFTEPDADAPWRVVLNWGDGSTPTTFSMTSTGTIPSQAHVYADKGTYTVTESVTNSDQGQDSKTFQVTVTTVPPAVTAPGNQTASEGASTSFALGSFSDPDPDAPWSVSVNWGDGSTPTTFTTSSTGTIPSQAHVYADKGTYTVTESVANSDQGQDSKTFQVAVATVPPTITPSANQSANEGSSTTFALGSFTDPDADAPWSVAVAWGDGTTSTFNTPVIGSLGNLAHRYADEGNYTASVTVTNTDQGSDTKTFAVAVANVVPVVTFAGPASGVRGQTRSFSGSFADPGADTWNATVNYGDGTGAHPLALNADKTFSFSPAYQTAGTYTVTVAVSDDDGASGSFSQTVTIKAVDVQPDPLNPGRTVLMVAGTTGNDTILINPGTSSGQYKVTINGVNQGTFSAPASTPFARLEVHGLAGDDTIKVSSAITLPGWLYGEDGNDNITGGSGPSVLMGGNGNDTLTGGSGRDLLIGGLGADVLNGGSGGNNILIAGYTAFDNNQAALEAIMAEWTSSRDYATRVKDLTDGSGSPSRLNGNVFLKLGSTVFNDGYQNTLITSVNTDWLFYDPKHDRIRKH